MTEHVGAPTIPLRGSSRYPASLRRALYRRGLQENIIAPQGAYTRPAIRPAPFYTPYGVQFVWDLPYSAYPVARVGGDVGLARGFVENMVEFAFADGPDAGMIPRHVNVRGDQGEQSGTQTPLLAWLAREVHRLESDEGFLARVYPVLADWIDWWQSPRRDLDGDGLSEYAGETPTFAAYESGHDYSPERDLLMREPTAPSQDGLVHEPFADVFLNANLYAELDALAAIAASVDPGRQQEWTERRDALAARMHEAMWDEDVGGFFPVVRRDLVESQPRVYRHTPALLQPLWAGLATQEQGQRTIETLLQRPRDYPDTDGDMHVRLDPALYHGYQIVTDGLHPTAGRGSAAGGVDLTDDGAVMRFGEDRGPATSAFPRLHVEVEVAEADAGGEVAVTVLDGHGVEHTPVRVTDPAGTVGGSIGPDPMETIGSLDWTPGLREVRLRADGCRVTRLTVGYSRRDRAGLLSSFGIKSAHPLDGKHPSPGAPTEFWSGTIWGPHSFHGAHALRRYGYEDLARAVARAYCDAVAGSFAASGDAFEHLSHEDGRGLGTAPYTWGAGVALVLMADFADDEIEIGP